MANAYQIAQSVVGQAIDFDGVYPYECVDLVLYVGNFFGCPLWGNGNQIGTIGNVTDYADVIPYSNGMELRVGDIISLDDPYALGYGHVVVFGGGSIDDALVCEQNYAGNRTVVQHRRNLVSSIPLRIVRFRNQDNYVPASGVPLGGSKPKLAYQVYEITCDEVKGYDSPNGNQVDVFYKCNKISGQPNGDWVIYNRYTGGVGYVEKSCTKERLDYNQMTKPLASGSVVNPYVKFDDNTKDGISQQNTQVIYSLSQFIQLGKVNWAGFEWTYKNETSLPKDVVIPDKITNTYGYLSDRDGYIILESPESWGNIVNRVYNTPFGFKGKVYSSKGSGSSLVVYIK